MSVRGLAAPSLSLIAGLSLACGSPGRAPPLVTTDAGGDAPREADARRSNDAARRAGGGGLDATRPDAGHADASRGDAARLDASPRDAASADAPVEATAADASRRDGRASDAGPDAATLVAQAGFFDVPPQATAAPYPSRIFWSFRPADEAPETKPLLVIYDGGPGAPTSSNLLVYGTGPQTLDPEAGTASPNPASFTRFANLLYLDERQAGFSYGLGDASAANTTCSYSILDDAADFIRAIAAFLGTHAPLASAQIVLVGESYGGTRTTAILHLAESLADDAVSMPSDVRSFFGAHGSQFGQAVLIEPLLAGEIQVEAQNLLEATDPYLAAYRAGLGTDAGCLDPYNVQERCGWKASLVAAAGGALVSPIQSTSLLGLELSTVTELLPPARTGAFRRQGVPDPWESDFVARFGALRPDDDYWLPHDRACTYEVDNTAAAWLVPVILSSRLFITDARYDTVVYSPSIPYLLEHTDQLVTSVDSTPQPGVARPGWIHVAIPTDAGTRDVVIRFPPYTSSGHMVAVTQAADLAADVEAWLGGGS